LLTTLKRNEKRSPNFVLGLLEFIHEDDASLTIVAGKVVVYSRAFLPPLVGKPWAKKVRLVPEIGTIDAVNAQREEPPEVPSQFGFAMTTGPGKKKNKRLPDGHGKISDFEGVSTAICRWGK
jgi:hypothetical protein